MNIVEVRNIKIGEGIPKICVPIVGVTKEDIINEAKTFDSIPADVVEWRADWFEGVFDFAHYKAIHYFLFSDLYDWAGQVRTVNISKKGTNLIKQSLN